LPEPFGPIRPTRSPKWISSSNRRTSPSIATSRNRTTIRAESPPASRTAICWSVTGAGGGPASTNRFQRVSAASARFAFTSEIAARCFMIL
jgi:hypothetical protein